MRWLLLALVLAAGSTANAQDARLSLLGKVVAVPDGDSIWVEIESAGACYHVTLSGPKAPSLDWPCGQEAREALVGLLLGQEVVFVAAVPLAEYGEIPADVFMDGCLVNAPIARGPLGRRDEAQTVAVPPRRPLLSLCRELRSIRLFRNRTAGSL